MRKTVLFLLLLPAFLAVQAMAQASQTLVFTHVTVIDGTGDAAKPEMTVVITDDRITALGRTGQVPAPKDARVVNAAGKFLIPGLWDMHAHIAISASGREERLPLLIANGITGVRDMFGSLELINLWRKEMAASVLLGPRIVAAGPILDGPGSRAFTVVSNEIEARQAVVKVKREGSDFVKVYSALSREAYFAIADEARRQHIAFAGHVPYSVSVAEASDAGQKSIEHLTGMVLAGSTREAELAKKLVQMPKTDAISVWKAVNRAAAGAIETYDEQKARRLFSRLVKNGTWQCPTLVVLRSGAFRGDPGFADDPRMKYMPLSTRQFWDLDRNPNLRFTAEDYAIQKKLYRKQLELVGAMQRAGVGILAGTDMGNPYVFPGFSLHDELELMVEAGLTPMQALQTATLNPARYLGKEEQLGTIGVGKLADLVLLDANPLVDIRNTKQINAVVVAGKLLDRAQRQAMLAQVEAVVKER